MEEIATIVLEIEIIKYRIVEKNQLIVFYKMSHFINGMSLCAKKLYLHGQSIATFTTSILNIDWRTVSEIYFSFLTPWALKLAKLFTTSCEHT
jgi:hypothetical protein